jgi:hypothetical protein
MSNGRRRRESANHKGRSRRGLATTLAGDSTDRLFAFTINPKTAEIVKLESLDSSGTRHELSEAEKNSLADAGAGEEIEDIVEQVFEAGIACVLGDEGPEYREESAEDAELRHLLLTPLIRSSSVGRLIQREALSHAILGTLIRHSITPSAPPRSSQAGAGTEPTEPT